MSGGPIGGIGGNEPALAGTGNLYENTRSYLMWALSPGGRNSALLSRSGRTAPP
jgi:hypothetical protein